jgi:hypothetical protein
MRQSIFSRLASYEDTNDVERLSTDPAMRHLEKRLKKDLQTCGAARKSQKRRAPVAGMKSNGKC